MQALYLCLLALAAGLLAGYALRKVVIAPPLTTIVRSFTYKLNVGNYESRDFFSSQKAEVPLDQAEATSEKLYQFCKAEVLRAVKEYKAEQEIASSVELEAQLEASIAMVKARSEKSNPGYKPRHPVATSNSRAFLQQQAQQQAQAQQLQAQTPTAVTAATSPGLAGTAEDDPRLGDGTLRPEGL